MILNIVCAPRPLYKLEEWLADFSDGLAEDGVRASLYNDDRLGRSLDGLFAADRNSMPAELSAGAIKMHALETEDLHNDTTSVTLAGDYENALPATVEPARGFNKDHRPDCGQIVFGLNMTADGNVPLSFMLFDGNRTDDTTHVVNWEELRKLLGKEDFLYVADCKLCSLENLRHIDGVGGKFVTVMPKNRKETIAFYNGSVIFLCFCSLIFQAVRRCTCKFWRYFSCHSLFFRFSFFHNIKKTGQLQANHLICLNWMNSTFDLQPDPSTRALFDRDVCLRAASMMAFMNFWAVFRQ